jgi:methyl-accepting chemotaxis protein
MTEEEYLRMKNILNTIIEQQAVFEENHRKADARMAQTEIRMSSNAEAIAALLTLAQMHEQEITKTNEQMNRGFDHINARFEQVATTFQELAKKTAETDERINALVNVVERYISKN